MTENLVARTDNFHSVMVTITGSSPVGIYKVTKLSNKIPSSLARGFFLSIAYLCSLSVLSRKSGGKSPGDRDRGSTRFS
jgi:hypothetical protein